MSTEKNRYPVDYSEADHSASKEERRKQAGEREIAEWQRFPAEANPETRQAIAIVRQESEKLMKDHPEVIGVGMFGSYLKGYATPKSDADLMIFFDFPLVSDARADERAELIEKRKALEIALKTLKGAIENRGLAAETYLLNAGIKSLERFLYEKDYEALAHIFLPCIGTEIRERRKWLLQELKGWGERGEKIWDKIASLLFAMENRGFSKEAKEKRIKFYQMDIDTALKKYC